MGAPVGNQNGRKAKVWEQAIKRALARMSNATVDKGLDKLAEQLVKAAESGEQWAIKEVGDRLDGKAVQQVDIDGELRQRDISGEPLTADEWSKRYGST
jgi:hypothetical protein